MAAATSALLSPKLRDVVPRVAGGATLRVRYGGGAPVADGARLTQAEAASAPAVSFDGPAIEHHHQQHQLFALAMIDPDAPSPDDPKMRSWLHLLAVNLSPPPGRAAADSDVLASGGGDVLVPYAGPTPPRGDHRYVFLLWAQPPGGRLPGNEHIETRGKFDHAKWAAAHNLGAPLAATYFTAAAGH